MESMKEIIYDQDMSMHLWDEEYRTIVYVQNITSHRVLVNKIPEEMFTREKLEIIHLRIFGFLVYVHVPKDKRMMFDPSQNKGIFFGCSETSKEFRIYIPCYKKFQTSKDVTFDEDTTFNISRKFVSNNFIRNLKLLD